MKDARPTITYLVIFLAMIGFPLALLGHMEYCVLVDGSKECGISFFDRFLQSPPNEIGDTLAGVFGSLAFLAAAIAVIMQSSELAAQREELQLTRLEFKAQRRATEDMAKATKLQAELLTDERRQRLEQEKKEELEQRLETLRIALNNYKEVEAYSFLADKVNDRGAIEQGEAVKVRPFEELGNSIDADRMVRFCVQNLSGSLGHLDTVEKQGKVLKCGSLSEWKRLKGLCVDVVALKNQLGESQVVRLANIRLEEFSQLIDGLLDKDIWEQK